MFYFFKGQTLNTFVLIVTNEFHEKDMLPPSMEVLMEKKTRILHYNALHMGTLLQIQESQHN